MDSVRESYNQWSETYDSVENPTRDLDKQILAELLSNIKGKIIIEAGCGTGKNTRWLSKTAEVVYAFDFSEGMLTKAKEKVKNSNVNFSRQNILEQWNFENESAHIVTINLVLEHINNLEFVFKEAFRVLKPEGKLVVCEYHPAKQAEGKQAEFRNGKNDNIQKIEAFVHTRNEFNNSLLNAGFTNIKMEDWFDGDGKSIPRILSIECIKE